MSDKKNNKEKITVKVRMSQVTKYTSEEKYAMFVEGKNRVPTPIKNKKKYTRKKKYKTLID